MFCELCVGRARAQQDEPTTEPTTEPTIEERPLPIHARWRLSQYLAALLNPVGLEHGAQLGLRAEGGSLDSLLTQGTFAEIGVVTYFSPVYLIGGPYIEVTPLSFLILRAEVTGVGYWPIALDGAGYYRLPSYETDVRREALPHQRSVLAAGWNLSLSATVRARIPLGPISLVFVDRLLWEHTDIGEGPYYYSMKRDLVLARRDWVLDNEAALLGELRAEVDLELRAGLFDQSRYVPASGYVHHLVGLMAMATWASPFPGITELSLVLRGGYYVEHVTRQDSFTVLGVVSLIHDLGPAY